MRVFGSPRIYRRRCGRCRKWTTELHESGRGKVCGTCIGRTGNGMCRRCYDMPHRRDMPKCRACGEEHGPDVPIVGRIYTGVSNLGLMEREG